MLKVLITALCLINVSQVFAQDQQNSETLVVFDPLFWKDDLKLSAGQYREINQINKEYYENLISLINENSGSTTAIRNATSELLQKRSERIWGTFHARQKKKWMKLSSEFNNPELSYSSARTNQNKS